MVPSREGSTCGEASIPGLSSLALALLSASSFQCALYRAAAAPRRRWPGARPAGTPVWVPRQVPVHTQASPSGAALRCWRSWRARCASRAGAAPSAGRPATPRSWAPRARQSLQSPRQGPGQGPCPLLRRTRPAATAAATAAVPRRAPAACGRGQGCTPCTAAPAAPAPARRAPARRSRAARTAWGRTRSPHGCPPCSRGASRRSTRSRRGHWPAPHCRGGVQRCVRYKWGGDGPARRHDVK